MSFTYNINTEPMKVSWEVNDFNFLECLGNGKFGYVYNAIEKKTQKEVAIKLICKNIVTQYSMLDQLKSEIEIHTRLIHPNIIRMYGYFYDSNYVYMIYEKATGGNLFELLKSGVKFTEKEVAQIVYQIASALIYIKKRNIIHRDLKLENVLVNKKPNGVYEVKVTDFGCACQYFNQRLTICGTTEYLSPEICLCLSYDFGVDTWALGVMGYELFCGCSPFSQKENKMTLDMIKSFSSFKDISQPLINIKATSDFIIFLTKALEKDSNKRIKIEDVLDLQWIKSQL